MGKLLKDCAHGLLETTPEIMQSIRTEMRRHRAPGLSVPQFRTLAFIQHNPDRSLSDLAEHLGLTLPSVSKLIDGLVKQEFIARHESPIDRRRVALALTREGESLLQAAHAGAQAHLTEILGQLADEELAVICRATELLQPLFVMAGRNQVSSVVR